MSGSSVSKKPGRRRRLLMVFLALPMVAVLGSNLILKTAWARGKVAGQLAKRSGLEWTIEQASWSPWGGVRLGGVEARIRGEEFADLAPLLVVRELRVRPYWASLFSGRPELQEVVVDAPVGELPLELLASLAPVQQARKGLEGKAGKPAGESPTPSEPGPEGGAGHPSDQEADKKTPGASGGSPPKKGTPTAKVDRGPGRPGRLVVRDGRLRVYSLTAPKMALEFEGVEGEVPLAGPEALGWLHMERVRVGALELGREFQADLTWKKPFLLLPITELKGNGVVLRTEAHLLVGRRPSVLVETKVPATAVTGMALPGYAGAQVSSERFELAGRFQGELLRPATWQGNLVAAVQGLTIDNDGQTLAVFDAGRMALDFRGGVLQLVDGRLVGEQFSVLGNGVLSWDGQVLGVVRLIGDWEYAAAINRIVMGALLSRWTSSWMRPLETPDRLYRDIRLHGTITKPLVNVGRKGEEMDAWTAWQRLSRFARGEQLEEERGDPASPERNPLIMQ